MEKPSEAYSEGTVIVGTGEFQLREVYVLARVEVKDGYIQKVAFTLGETGGTAEAEAIAEQLKGQPLSRALEVKARELDFSHDQHGEPVTKVALLEAFHRAVEVCLENE